jgi:predicted RNA-binding Zn ribbon-like protein
VGNALCLDFVNTVSDLRGHGRDHLGSYADVLAWAVHAGALPEHDAAVIGSAVRRPAHALARVRDFRAHLHGLFAALVAGAPPPSADVAALGVVSARALRHARFVRSGNEALASWPPVAPEAPMWPVAWSATTLLAAAPLERLRACPGCGWLFLDTSRNGGRRWCSMSMCGSREKMRRYRRSKPR